MTLPSDPYRVLGLTPGASANEIRSAYRRLAKQFHPDAAGERAVPRFLAIRAAYERLVDGDGQLRPPSAGTRGRPPSGWAADPERTRATRDAYRARRSAGWTAPGGGGTTDEPGRSGPRAGAATGAAGPRTRPPDDDPRPGRPGAADRGSGTGGRRGGGGRRSTRKATPGSTSYDEAAEIPRDPSWEGAGWYGPASGTFWTINPHEYADPRKHGPEYQARARRAAEAEGERRGRPGAADDELEGEQPVAGTAGTDAEGTDAGWQWAAAGSRTAGSPGTRTEAGSEDWSADGWSYRSEPDDPGDPWSGPHGARVAASPAPPLPDLESLIGRLSPTNLRRQAARGDIRTRVTLALIGWPPVGFGVATLIGELSGCASFSAGCVEPASWMSTAAQPAIVAVLVLLPALAAILAFATLGTLAVTVPFGLLLGLATATDPDPGRGVLAFLAGATYLVALAGAVIWGRRRRTADTP